MLDMRHKTGDIRRGTRHNWLRPVSGLTSPVLRLIFCSLSSASSIDQGRRGRIYFHTSFWGHRRMYLEIELFMDKWLLRCGNPTRSENIPALSAGAEALSAAATPSPSEADGPSEARSRFQYVEMVNFLYGFTAALG